MKTQDYLKKIGNLIQETRLQRGMTQSDLANAIGSSQSAVNRIEKGEQNVSLEMVAKVSHALSREIVRPNPSGKTNFVIRGGKKLSGEISVKTSKNAAVSTLCASLLTTGKTRLKKVARIEEVYRIIEVLESIGVKVKWLEDNDLEITPPQKLELDKMNIKAAERTRSIIMFLGPLMHRYSKFNIPFSGGCNLGSRTIQPHLDALEKFGLQVRTTNNKHEVSIDEIKWPKSIVLTERGDTVTENAIMAAAGCDKTVTIRNASPNYMVQDLCFYLQKLGVKIEGIGTTVLTITGVEDNSKNVEYAPSQDPIEAMSLIAASVITESELKIKKCPIEFLELELVILEKMGLRYKSSEEYFAENQKTRLVDLTIYPSKLVAAKDKLHCMPFPGVNMDNLPFLGLIATMAEGRTLIHDWSYENRAIYFTELSKLNASVEMIDPHRVYITGKTKWKSADVISPPALRPSVVVMLAMLAAPGESILRDIYSINRGYEDFANRLNSIGADIETVSAW